MGNLSPDKRAIKLNLLPDHDGYLPVFMDFMHGDVHEVTSARHMDLPRDRMVLCDRGHAVLIAFHG